MHTTIHPIGSSDGPQDTRTRNMAAVVSWLRAWHRWQRLAQEPGAWEDPERRRAMLAARLDYQDALMGVGTGVYGSV